MRAQLRNGFSGQPVLIIRLIGTLVALVLLVYLLRQQGWREIGDAIGHISSWRLILAMGLMVVSRLAVSGRWYVLLRSAGLKIKFGQSLRITFAGLFASNFLPTTVGGDVIRLAGALQLNLDAAVCTASLIVDRLVGMAGMAMVAPFGLPRFLEANTLPVALDTWRHGEIAAIASAPLGKWGRLIWIKGISIINRMVVALSLWLKQPRSLLTALFFTWIHMLCLFSILTLLLAGTGERVPFWLVGGLYSIIYFITLLPFSINGYGIQEVSMTVIFSVVGGASVQSGLTVALLFRTLMMLASLPGVAFVTELLPKAALPQVNETTKTSD